MAAEPVTPPKQRYAGFDTSSPLSPTSDTFQNKQPTLNMTDTPIAASNVTTLSGLKNMRQGFGIEMRKRWTQLSLDKFYENLDKKRPDDSTIYPQPGFMTKALDKMKKEVPNIKESDMYPILCRSIQKIFQAAKNSKTPSLSLRDTGERPDEYVKSDSKEQNVYHDYGGYDGMPDIAIYQNGEEFQHASSNPHIHHVSTSRTQRQTNPELQNPDREEFAGPTEWATMTAFLEIKLSDKYLAFGMTTDDEDKFLTSENQSLALDARAQITEYVAEIKRWQHRTHIYTVFIFKNYARLMRWDSLGAIVSAPFDYNEQPKDFFDFFDILANMSPSERGYDPTVKYANNEEQQTWYISYASEEIEHIKEAAKNAFNDNQNQKQFLWKITMDWQDGTEVIENLKTKNTTVIKTIKRSFLIGKPNTALRAATGRCTKGYIALDLQTSKFVHLKDFWRSFSEQAENIMDHEFGRHCYLKSKDVPQITTPLWGNDVMFDNKKQLTLSHAQLSTQIDIQNKVHCRIICKEYGQALRFFPGSQVLVQVVVDAITAHKHAYNAGILHRDPSETNIIMYKSEKNDQWSGYLIDWGLSKKTSDLGKGASDHTRSGTLRFLSAISSTFPGWPHTLEDDLESFYHILNFLALRYFPIRTYNNDLVERSNVYSKYSTVDDQIVGNSTKFSYMTSGQIKAPLLKDYANSGFIIILKKLTDLFRKRYAKWEYEDLNEEFGIKSITSHYLQVRREYVFEASQKLSNLSQTAVESSQPAFPVSQLLSSPMAATSSLVGQQIVPEKTEQDSITHEMLIEICNQQLDAEKHKTWEIENDRAKSSDLQNPIQLDNLAGLPEFNDSFVSHHQMPVRFKRKMNELDEAEK